MPPPPPCLSPSEAYAHIYWAGEINSDLNVLSWCVSVVKASVNRVQKRTMLLLVLFVFLLFLQHVDVRSLCLHLVDKMFAMCYKKHNYRLILSFLCACAEREAE